MLGADGFWCADTDKQAHLTTCCLEMPLSMARSVNVDHTHQILKYVACVFVGGSPPVDIWSYQVPIGVGLLTPIRKHTSVATNGINTLHAHIYCVGLHTSCYQCIFHIILGPSVVKLSTDHIFFLQLSYLFVLSLYVIC